MVAVIIVTHENADEHGGPRRGDFVLNGRGEKIARVLNVTKLGAVEVRSVAYGHEYELVRDRVHPLYPDADKIGCHWKTYLEKYGGRFARDPNAVPFEPTHAWEREGWMPVTEKGRCRCPDCGATISVNAFARKAHRGSKKCRARSASTENSTVQQS
jgi:hypothetical protein